MEDFKKWFIKTYVKNEDKESALKLAEMYNPTGKILTTVLTDMEEYFVQAEELLTVHRACLLLKRKVPRDVLTEVTREDLHNLEELVNKIMDREEFLYPEMNRKIMVTDIETR
eukprot:Nk52_evm1s2200 gene=Nk52_evmTU1s2200